MSDLAQTSPSMSPAAAATVSGPHFGALAEGAATKATSRPRQQKVLMAAEDVRKSYRKGQVAIPVLKGVDVQIRHQEFLSIVGKSGSGKSTLLHLLATLDAPDAGQIQFQGHRIDNLPAARRDRVRNRQLGIVFQFYHLLPEFTTLENVVIPALIDCPTWSYFSKRRELKRRAHELIERVGLAHRLKHRPRELSGGEMQRVAIARALMNQPKILLADEPTGNLDRQTGTQIMELLRSLNVDHDLTIVMVTHDAALAKQTDRMVQLVEGRVSQA